MWDSILKILEEKVSEGVEVRVIYDDAGCISTLKKDYNKFLESKGIKCVVFNKLNPLSGVIMNNRDHRKIVVIDGKIAYTELVPEITQEPDYDKAIAAVK